MKKTVFFFALGALLLSSCAGKDQKKIEEDSAKIADLTAEYEEATNFNDSLMLLMGDIYTGLDSINTQEGLLYNMGAGDAANRRAEIRHNLSAIKARLAANKQLLEQMEAKVKASGADNSVQAKTIAQLRQHIEQQDAKIAQLESELSNAKTEITNLNTKVAETQEQVATETAAKEEAQAAATAAENEANIVYYAIGSNKELKNKGLLEKKFLGATKVLKGNFDASYFVKGDKRNLTSIPTNAKKVKIWTNMPENSYRIVGEKNGPKTIEIVNPDKFWSLTNHLVIQTD
jgi:DNA repair exonuclease SbcCD ATPase subunit